VKLPPELYQLYKVYLLVIRPVEINFARRLWGKDAALLYHEYMYVMNGVRLLETQFYLQFRRWTELYFNCSLGVRAYRQSVVVVARAYLGTEYELELEEEDDALIKQRGHGALADRRCYGVQSSYLTTLSSDLMFRFGHMSEWWWRLTQFLPGRAPLLPLDIRRKLQDSDSYIPFHSKDKEWLSEPKASIPATQASLDEDRLSALISASVTAAVTLLKDNMEDIIASKVAAGVAEALSRQSSVHIQAPQHLSMTPLSVNTMMDVDLPDSTPPCDISGLTPLSSSDTLVSQSMDIDSGHHSPLAQVYLKQFYKDIPEPQFRSKAQAQMVEMAFTGTNNFIGILPTGGGKSLVFLLPAFAATVNTAPNGTVMKTLVIIPNKALLADTLQKALKLNVSCEQWTVRTSDHIIKNTALLLIAIESLASYKFRRYVMFLITVLYNLLLTLSNSWYRDNEKSIQRFVVDECHQVITCSDYRKKFDAVKELAQYCVQKIYLTATLGPYLEDHFLQQVYLPRSTHIIREPTNRKNFMYHVLHIEERVRKAKDVIMDLVQLVEKDTWTAASCGIIFCISRADVDELGALLGNTKSHSDMETADRLDLQEKWYQGLPGHRWMVATTGFIQGIDHPNVDTVIFLEMPYGLTNFVQGSGRAGRSGGPAHIFMLDYHTTFIQPRKSEIDAAGIIPGTKFVQNTSECRRGIVSDVMDGFRIFCSDLHGAITCDLCNPSHPLVIASKKLLLSVRSKTPDYDVGGWDDTTLALLDPTVLDATPSSSVQSTQGPEIFPASINLQVTQPSMSLCLDQAIYIGLQQDKRGKTAELSSMTKALGGILDGCSSGYCVICWAWKNKWVLKTPQHQYFIHCKTKEDQFVRHAVGWIQLKRQFHFEKFHYCWRCGLPQGDFTPVTHPIFKPGTMISCPFDDLVILLIWHIIHTEDIWEKACLEFAGLTNNMPQADITNWLKKEEQPHLFYNGLELVIWYWITYKKNSINC
jgi:superfamily II DNA helicase RecQ